MKKVILAGVILVALLWFVALEQDVPVPPAEQSECLQLIEYQDCFAIPEELSDMRDVKAKKRLFVQTLLPLVLKANDDVRNLRNRVVALKYGGRISDEEEVYLRELALDYRIEVDDLGLIVEELLARVDVLPPSLMLAQAAVESGWGTSRFSREGNNLFGLRTPSGPGIRPQRQNDGRIFRVSRFASLQECMDFYLWTINTHQAYDGLRQIRKGLDLPYDPLILAQGLEAYSEQGELYVEKIRGLVIYNDLRVFDSYCLADTEAFGYAEQDSNLTFLTGWMDSKLKSLKIFN